MFRLRTLPFLSFRSSSFPKANLNLKSRYISPSTTNFSTSTMTMMKHTLPRLPIFTAIKNHDPDSTVVIHSKSGRKFTYGELLYDVALAKEKLVSKGRGKEGGIEGERIAFLVENGYDYVVTLLSILGTHSIALPLSPAFPASELQYILNQSQAMMLLSSDKFEGKAGEVLNQELDRKPKHVKVEKRIGGGKIEEVELEGKEDGEGGMMLYTSGTTARPKGVLLPQRVMTAQSKSLIQAWEYTPSDHLLHVLPLHHIHGTINAIFAPLIAGSTIEFLFPFNATSVWNRFSAPFLQSPPNTSINTPQKTNTNPITFFTTVPTVYNRLLSTFPDLPQDVQSAAKKGISPDYQRLAISGSAALPTPTKKAWSDLSSGNTLLERYGMTEVGMALSCGLSPSDRIDGSVGFPLPSVQIRLVDPDTKSIIPPPSPPSSSQPHQEEKEQPGEIQLRGPTIFTQYFNNPSATAKEFISPSPDDGLGPWFKTGDIAVRKYIPSAGQSALPSQKTWAKGPMYFIHGRLSSDIIKSGGEKISALEVEHHLLSLPQISEIAVVGLPSDKWGQKVGCVVVLKDGCKSERKGKEGRSWGPLDMRIAMRGGLVGYKIPRVMKVVSTEELGRFRNAMGKVNKKRLVKEMWGDMESASEGSGNEK